jgi:hypothetical protein
MNQRENAADAKDSVGSAATEASAAADVPETAPAVENGSIQARVLRRIAASIVALSAAATAACITITLMSGLLKFNKEAFGFLFGCMRLAALSLFVSAAAACFLDSMYRAFGLLQARLTRIAALFFLALGSLLPLAASYAFLRLAAGFQA